MIEIKCSGAQLERLIKAAACFGLDEQGRCVLGKNHTNCPSLYGDKYLSCEACIRQKLKRIKEPEKANDDSDDLISKSALIKSICTREAMVPEFDTVAEEKAFYEGLNRKQIAVLECIRTAQSYKK